MRRVAVLLLCACADDGAARFEMNFSALALPVSEYQVAVLTDRASVDCTAVSQTCLKDAAFPASRFVDLQDSRGATVKAVRFAADAGVNVSMSPGKDLAFVLEALTEESPPRLLASACKYVASISAGANSLEMTLTRRADGGVVADCDPRL